MKEESKPSGTYTIGFYNLENLFDTTDDEQTRDDDFTPDSEKKWTPKRFRRKLKKLSSVITSIGYEKVGHPPVLLGVAEVENAEVLEALIATKHLANKGYDFVHFDSPDERGIDTGLLFRTKYFEVLSAETHSVYLTDEDGSIDHTRDILHVHGTLVGEPLHILVNHWPSRRKGTEETAHKRMIASEKNIAVLNHIREANSDARIIVMGDFNDNPHSASVKTLTGEGLYNPMELLLTHTEGSLRHDQNWYIFDQIIISYNFLQGHANPMQFEGAHIHDPDHIKEYDGKFKGQPFRTYAGKRYLGGFSDHFPVYTVFSID